MNKDSSSPPLAFLDAYATYVNKWVLLKSSLAGLSALLFFCSFGFLLAGKDGFAAIFLTVACICFFILYSLSFTIKELVTVKALQCKQAVESLYDLENETLFYECAEQYNILASAARKQAFQYDSDTIDTSVRAFIKRIQRYFSWQEYHLLEEICLIHIIDLFTRKIRSTPCDITLHARLANAYVLLQNHYVEPIQAKKLMAAPSLYLSVRTKALLKEKAKQAAALAVDELEIMSSYASDTLWVHEQLAISFRQLGMQKEEIQECEKLLLLSPDDPLVLLRLGILYFLTGKNGKGLTLYGQLKELNPQLGKELISHYGTYTPFLNLERE